MRKAHADPVAPHALILEPQHFEQPAPREFWVPRAVPEYKPAPQPFSNLSAGRIFQFGDINGSGRFSISPSRRARAEWKF